MRAREAGWRRPQRRDPRCRQDSGVAEALGAGGGGLRAHLNEAHLLHGVADLAIARSILHNGMNWITIGPTRLSADTTVGPINMTLSVR